MPYTYFVKLIPEKYFFFGKGSKVETGSYGNNKNYFLNGLQFPQQTSVLGLMRYILLLNNKLLNTNSTNINIQDIQNADSIIGEKSFDGSSQKFGVIDELSPVFITDPSNNHFFLRSKEFVTPIDDEELMPILRGSLNKFTIKNGSIEYSNISPFQYNLDNTNSKCYSYKDPFNEVFINETGGFAFTKDNYNKDINSKWKNQSYIFSETEKIGIRKGENGQTEEEAFYKQTYLQFRNNYCFGFYITLSKDLLPESTILTTFGKEQLTWKLIIKKQEKPPFEAIVFGAEATTNKVLLLSDSVVSPSFIDSIDLSISQITNFANLATTTSNSNYSGLDKFLRTPNQFIMKRGSVFFIKDKAKFENAINNPNYYKIGMNNYINVGVLTLNQLNPL